MRSKILKHQQWTIGFLIIFLPIFFYTFQNDAFLRGDLWGISTHTWALLSIGMAILHQMYVLFSWRLEIHNKTFTKVFKNKAFTVYVIGFFIGFYGRIILVFILGYSNKGSSSFNPTILNVVAFIMAIPMFWTFYSVARYFGMARAAGADHFLAEYRDKPFVKEGIYKYTSNAMYKYAMFIIWMPGLLFGSSAALLIALFNHIYVWVHYYTLEKPDWDILYPKK